MEHVLVIKRALFDSLGSFQGFCGEVDRYLGAFLNPENNFFMERPAAERYLVYTRGGSSGEKRLVAKHSIGIGGHINPVDQSHDSLGETMYFNGVERELAEELVITSSHTQRVIGLINDDSNEVGSVHLGVVHVFDLDGDAVASNEDAIQDIRFVPLDELHRDRENLETWSRICVEHLWSAR